jgi:hypothetical protein
MKKFTMLVLTLLLLFLTAVAYAVENNDRERPELKLPALNLASPKFGQITNIAWLSNFVGSERALLFLTAQAKAGTPYSSLYYFNIDTGEIRLLGEYPAHRYLDRVILFDSPFNSNSVITAFAQGIVKTGLHPDNNGKLNPEQEFVPIDGFAEATGFDAKGPLFYTKADDPLLYTRTFSRDPLAALTGAAQPDAMTFFRKPAAIINANPLDQVLAYTSLEGGRYNLYCMGFNGSSVTPFNRPVLKDIIHAQAIEDGYGFIGWQEAAPSGPDAGDTGNSPQLLNLFMARRYAGATKAVTVLDTIPYYTDPTGAVPALDSTTFNEDYTLIYTVYDSDHRGKIKICGYNRQPQTIVEGENIFGPVRIARKDSGAGRTPLILYFTREENRVKIKICDQQGKLVKDITDKLLGAD